MMKIMYNPKIYMASKTKHFQKWIDLRNNGVNIISTWIDEAGDGKTLDKKNLCLRVINEIKECDYLIVYVEEGEFLKGALIEMGVAMGFDKPIIMIGSVLKYESVFTYYHSIKQCLTINDALNFIKK